MSQLVLRTQNKLIDEIELGSSDSTISIILHYVFSRETHGQVHHVKNITSLGIVGNQNNKNKSRNVYILEEYKAQFLKRDFMKDIKCELFILMSIFGEQYPLGNPEYLERESV